MARPHAWSVFRGISRRDGIDYERIGTVAAWTESEALAAAERLPGAPANPVVAHLHLPGVLSEEPRPLGLTYSPRRSRRHLGRAA